MSDSSQILNLLIKPVKELFKAHGFTELTPPQLEAIPFILKGENVLVIAPTGTGKTEAAFLPVLQKILSTPREYGVKLIYITPLRALNRDLLERLEWWCRRLDVRINVRHGDTLPFERRKQVIAPPDVLITTPETLQIILNGKLLRETLKTVKWVIVDEVHELAENKRGVQLTLSLEKLRWTIGRDFQIIGLSATVGSPKEAAKLLCGVGRECKIVYVPVAKKIKVDVVFPTPSRKDFFSAQKFFLHPEVAARLRVIREIIDRNKTTLLFTNTRTTAELLTSRFKLLDLKTPINIHHGSLSTATRLKSEQGLKEGEYRSVICTSSLELGIDIGTIDFCIQYNSPRQVTRLIQRIGRSGHKLEEVSKGVVVVQNSDDALESLAIIKNASKEKLEPLNIPDKPLDVLMHEITSYLIVKGKWGLEELFNLVKKAYPYRNLEKEELVKLLLFMENLPNKFVWFSREDGEFGRGRNRARLYNYFYQNLSMIPEVKQYLVINEEDNLPVGLLDDFFVAEHGTPGTKFVISGKPWKIIQVFEDKVYVSPEEDYLGSIPSWVGEYIPVPFEIAQEVGELRGIVERMVKEGRNFTEIVEETLKVYPFSKEALIKGLKDAYIQASKGLPLPTNKRVLIEKIKGHIIVHMHFGTKVNRTLGLYLSSKLTDLTAENIYIHEGPYRIIINTETLTPSVIKEILVEHERDIETYLEPFISRSGFFKWRLTHVAQRMGVLEKKVRVTNTLIEQLLTGLKDTPVYVEALKEVKSKDLDLEKTTKVLEKIREGEIEIQVLGEQEKPTEIAKNSFKFLQEHLEPFKPEKNRMLRILSVKTRILSESRVFVCLNCLKYVEERKVFELEPPVTCPFCKSKRVGLVNEPVEKVRREIETLKGKKGVEKKNKIWRKLVKTSELVSLKGILAVIVLTANISFKKAKKLIEREDKVTNKLFEEIWRAEREELLNKFEKAKYF